MANYSLVANSTFQPFSYQELIAPIDRQNAYHEKLMDEYDKLSSQADVLEAMGANDRDKDSKVYQQYKNYSDRLRTEADNLYRNGLNTESRMRLSELRRMYNTDIVPIQNAWQKREKEAELQMKAQLDASSKGIDLYFSRNAADTPLQSYLDNPNQTFRTINGQALMNEVAAQFKAMANQIQVDKNGNPWIGKQQLSPIEYSIITQKGMDYNQYMDFINNPNDPRFANIKGIINSTLTAHGAQDFDPTTQQRLFGLASQGVAAGVGERDMQFHTDEWAKMQETYNQQLDLARRKGEIPGDGDVTIPDLLDVQQGSMPIAIADGDIDSTVVNNAKAFGWEKNSKSPNGYYPGKMNISFSDGYARNISVDLFDNSGNVKRWAEFSKDVEASLKNTSSGAKKKALEQARTQFDNAVKTAMSLGLNPQKGYTRQDVANALAEQKTTGTAGYINGFNWNHKNGDWNPTMQNMNVQEIKKVDHDGKFTLDSKLYTLGDLLDTSSDAKINKSKQEVAALISVQNGQEGVIFKVGNRQFFMPREAIVRGNFHGGEAYRLFAEASDLINEAEKYKDTNPNDALAARTAASWKVQTAISQLETGFNMYNAGVSQKGVEQPTQNQRYGK